MWLSRFGFEDVQIVVLGFFEKISNNIRKTEKRWAGCTKLRLSHFKGAKGVGGDSSWRDGWKGKNTADLSAQHLMLFFFSYVSFRLGRMVCIAHLGPSLFALCASKAYLHLVYRLINYSMVSCTELKLTVMWGQPRSSLYGGFNVLPNNRSFLTLEVSFIGVGKSTLHVCITYIGRIKRRHMKWCMKFLMLPVMLIAHNVIWVAEFRLCHTPITWLIADVFTVSSFD